MQKLISGLIILILCIAGCAGLNSASRTSTESIGMPDNYNKSPESVKKGEKYTVFETCEDKRARSNVP